jgi:hypothetical protein
MTLKGRVFNVWRSGAVVAVGVLIGGFASPLNRCPIWAP